VDAVSPEQAKMATSPNDNRMLKFYLIYQASSSKVGKVIDG